MKNRARIFALARSGFCCDNRGREKIQQEVRQWLIATALLRLRSRSTAVSVNFTRSFQPFHKHVSTF
ncbi:MAG: hypothetical protein QMB67_08710, partial [Sulfurospirillum sp.]